MKIKRKIWRGVRTWGVGGQDRGGGGGQGQGRCERISEVFVKIKRKIWGGGGSGHGTWVRTWGGSGVRIGGGGRGQG